jgi:hypothetical protein
MNAALAARYSRTPISARLSKGMPSSAGHILCNLFLMTETIRNGSLPDSLRPDMDQLAL